VIAAFDILEHRMVVHPHDADSDEAENEAHIRRPLVHERAGEALATFDVRHRDFDHKQGDRDRDNTVAEGL
jgi:hypothetical protein